MSYRRSSKNNASLRRLHKMGFVLLIALFLVCMSLLSACNQIQLYKPTKVVVDYSTKIVSWDADPNSKRFKVSINDKEYDSSTNRFSLDFLDEGTYTIKVRALPRNRYYSRSIWSDEVVYIKDRDSGLVYSSINDGSEYEVVGIGTATGDIVMDRTYKGLPITRIADSAFANATAITSFEVGELVTSIGRRAFYNCSSMKSITIPDNVVSIGDFAFQSCRVLTSVILPSGLTSIGESMFAYCRALEEVNIPEAVTSIGKAAFANCSALLKIEAPAGLKSIGESAFQNATALAEVVLRDGVTEIGKAAFQNATALTSINLTAGITVISENAFLASGLTSINIPSTVTHVGPSSFSKCEQLTTVTFAEGSANLVIGNYAFSDSSRLSNVDIPDRAVTVGYWAFQGTKTWLDRESSWEASNKSSLYAVVYMDNWAVGCLDTNISTVELLPTTVGIANFTFAGFTHLVRVKVPSTLVRIGDGAFNGCLVLESFYSADQPTEGEVFFGASLKSVGAYAFSGNVKVKYQRGGENVDIFGEGAFYECSTLQEINIANTVKIIDSYAFYGCEALDATGITLGNGLQQIGVYSFAKTKFWVESPRNVIIGKWLLGDNSGDKVIDLSAIDIVGIADYAFLSNTMLENITLPNSLLYIGKNAFQSAESLTQITIPSGVTAIRDHTFAYATALTTVTFLGEVSSIGRSAFYKCAALTTIELPTSLTAINDYTFYQCTSLVSINLKNVTSIGRYAFYECTSLVAIAIPSSVTAMGEYAFAYSGLTSVVIGSGLTRVPDRAFYKCASLATIVIPNNITEIGMSAFYEATALVSLNLGSALKTIGDYAFYGAASLTTLNLPQSLTSIGMCAFYNAAKLSSLTIPASVKTIGQYAFYGTAEMVTLTLTEGLQEIGAYAFYGAAKLTTFFIPSSVTSIGEYAFFRASSLLSVIIPANVERIGRHAFAGSPGLTIYVERAVRPDTYNSRFNSSNRPVLWGCTLSAEKTYVVSFTRTVAGGLQNPNAIGGLYPPIRQGHSFAGWSLSPTGNIAYSMSNLKDAPLDTSLYAIWLAN